MYMQGIGEYDSLSFGKDKKRRSALSPAYINCVKKPCKQFHIKQKAVGQTAAKNNPSARK
jgi:hypothetical protein